MALTNKFDSFRFGNSTPDVAQILPGTDLKFETRQIEDCADAAKSYGEQTMLIVFRTTTDDGDLFDVVEYETATEPDRPYYHLETRNYKHFQSLEEVENWDGDF